MIFILRRAEVLANLKAHLDAKWEKLADTKPLIVEVMPWTTKRTALQNRYYWASLQGLAEDGWYQGRLWSKEVWHEYFSEMFLYRVELPNGKTAPTSTTKLEVGEFNKYIERINLWTSEEMGIPFGKSPEEFGGL